MAAPRRARRPQRKPAISEGAEIVLGPLFSHAVAAAGQVTRTRSVPMIAFSTDSNVAARGIYLLSFQPENDIDRVITFAAARGKKSIIAFVPDNAYGNVVEAAIKQYAGSRSAKIVALQRYDQNASDIGSAVRRIAGESSARPISSSSPMAPSRPACWCRHLPRAA